MDALHVRRIAVRCRVASSSRADRDRAERLFQGPVATALERALESTGFGVDEEICIRTLRAPAKLWLGMTDEALLNAWAGAVSSGARQALDAGDKENVVRYSSFIAGVLDAVRGVARGQLGRRWAWRQLGLQIANSPATALEAPGEAIVRLLMR